MCRAAPSSADWLAGCLALRLLKYFKQRFEMKSSRLETRPTQFAGWFVYYVCNLIFSRQDGISLHPREPQLVSLAIVHHHPPTNTVSSGRLHYIPLIECFFLMAVVFIPG